jgi:predicted 2-oxoglutarate/Fe(II)-dependent dioxygenase YbiX
MASEPGPLRRGDRAPDFVLPDERGIRTRFYGIGGGRVMVLLFAESAVAIDGVEIMVVARGAPVSGLKTFVDSDGALAALYRVTEPTAIILDANLRVLAVLRSDDLAGIREATKPTALPAIELGAQAPVLLVPNALDPDLCAETIAWLEAHGSAATGVERSSEGRRENVVEPSYKQRRDHTVEDPIFLRRLTEAVGRRVVPEVERAFAYNATRFEGFKIAAYDVGGFFKPHRDNLSPSTAHRRFALTLNLNDGYEGGQLRFPEHAPHLYRPPAGGALIFSCSLLHEALPVLSGTRMVLLSFLFSASDQRARPR